MGTVTGRAIVGGVAYPVTAPVTLPAAGWDGYGVTPGTVLTDSGGISVGNGAVVTGKAITVSGGIFAVRSTASNPAQIPVVSDCKIVATNTDQAFGFGGFIARHCDISGSADGAKANGYTTIDGCHIHDLAQGSGMHNDGIQVTNGAHIQILDTKIIIKTNQTSCIMVGSDQGPIDDVLIRGGFYEIAWNAQAGYCIYPGDSACTNVRLEGCVFSTRFGKGRALYPSRPKTGWMRGCKYDDGTPIPDETWG